MELDFLGGASDIGAFETVPQVDSVGIAPIAQLLFESQSDFRVPDTSAVGRDRDGQLFGNARLQTGLNGQAVEFRQAGDGIAIANSPDLNLGIHPQRTVSFWFRGNDIDQSRSQILYEEGRTARGLNAYIQDGKLIVGGWNRAESQWSGTWLETDQIRPNQ